jgi:hypothetical protein
MWGIPGEIFPTGFDQFAAEKFFGHSGRFLIFTVEFKKTTGIPKIPERLSKFRGKGLLLKRDRQFFQEIFEFRISVPAGGKISGGKTVVPVVPGKNEYIAPALLFGKLQRVPDSAEKAEYHGIIFFSGKNIVNTAASGNHVANLVFPAVICQNSGSIGMLFYSGDLPYIGGQCQGKIAQAGTCITDVHVSTEPGPHLIGQLSVIVAVF